MKFAADKQGVGAGVGGEFFVGAEFDGGNGVFGFFEGHFATVLEQGEGGDFLSRRIAGKLQLGGDGFVEEAIGGFVGMDFEKSLTAEAGFEVVVVSNDGEGGRAVLIDAGEGIEFLFGEDFCGVGFARNLGTGGVDDFHGVNGGVVDEDDL